MHHTEETSNLSMRQSLLKQPSDLTYTGIGKFRGSFPLSASHSSVANAVSYVLGVSPPAQITETVIEGIPVKMPAFHIKRAGTHKSFENKPMYPRNFFVFSIVIEADRKMSHTIVTVRVGTHLENSLSSSTTTQKALHTSVIRDFVTTLVANNRLPDFEIRNDVSRNLGFHHAHLSLFESSSTVIQQLGNFHELFPSFFTLLLHPRRNVGVVAVVRSDLRADGFTPAKRGWSGTLSHLYSSDEVARR
jgi:hypothetical protein